MKVYLFPISQPSRSVRLLLDENKIEYELEIVNIMKPRTPEFLAVNPGGFVPVITDGDMVLTEGAAIMTYICQTHKLTDWLPEDPKVQAKVNQWMHWHHDTTRTATTKILRPAMGGKEIDDTILKKALDTMEAALAKSPFLAGTDKPTIADLLILTELDQLGFFKTYDISKWVKVSEWVVKVGEGLPNAYKALMSKLHKWIALRNTVVILRMPSQRRDFLFLLETRQMRKRPRRKRNGLRMICQKCWKNLRKQSS